MCHGHDIGRKSVADEGVNEWKRRSGETRERGRLVPGDISTRATFSISADPRDARISVVVVPRTLEFPHWPSMFPTGCCILNVFTLASDPDRTLACLLPLRAPGISTRRTSSSSFSSVVKRIQIARRCNVNGSATRTIPEASARESFR